jgi:hypothetical protein
VTARTLLTIIENLTADGEDGKGAPSPDDRYFEVSVTCCDHPPENRLSASG